jgi:long-chain acyl-CoA synthetase
VTPLSIISKFPRPDPANNEVPTGDVGEIVIRGHNVMKGYFNKPEATAEAFQGTRWFHTGVLGRMDEDGYLFIVDRVKDMIIRGGFNVYPREIEEVLMTHPAVSLASVIGVPHDQHGEEIKAYLVLFLLGAVVSFYRPNSPLGIGVFTKYVQRPIL